MNIEDQIKQKLEQIFDFKKVSFNLPADDVEQNCLYVAIENSNIIYKENLCVARIFCSCRVFAPNEKLPVGYVSKKIALSAGSLTNNFFFYDIEENAKIFLDIIGKSFKFIYFYDGQFNPNEDKIEGIEINDLPEE